ncbi:MAG: YibE/F family protein [Peptococcaceae bacterium]
MKKLCLILLLLICFIPTVVRADDSQLPADEPLPTEYAKGEVIEILEQEFDKEYGAGMTVDYQKLQVKILNGQFKNEIVTIENSTTGNPAYDIWFQKGDKVLLMVEILAGDLFNSYIVDFQRDTYLFVLAAIFIILLIIIGRKQGLKAVITLGLTMLIIGKIMLPLLFKGYSPVWLALLTGIFVNALTFLIISGFSKKTLSAILGTTGGLLAAALIAMLIGYLTNLKGLSGEEAQMLLYIPQEINFDYRGLLFAGIIIGSLGAVMDVSMSIASAMEEINKIGTDLSFKELFGSGMNVGKDIMGTMSNTLILAYTGTSLPLLLLFMAYEQPFVKLINMDFLATEFIRALSGSFGLVLAIPLTALASGFLFKKHTSFRK